MRLFPLLLLIACRSERQAVQLADSLNLPAGQSVELRSREPLRTPALSRDGRVCFQLQPPLTPDAAGFAIRTPAGQTVVPEVTLIRRDGGARALTQASYLSNAFCLGLGDGSDVGPPYVAVRVRSPEPLQLGTVRWLSTDK